LATGCLAEAAAFLLVTLTAFRVVATKPGYHPTILLGVVLSTFDPGLPIFTTAPSGLTPPDEVAATV
jgi:hypothetical protein